MINNIRLGQQVIAGIYLGNTLIRRMYNGNLVVYDMSGESPCFEVVSTLVYASGYYVDVYCTGNKKWYKLNNLNSYEEYGVYEDTSDLSSTTYYTGKLVILSTDNHEYRWDGSSWTDCGSARSNLTIDRLWIDPASSGNASFTFGYKYGNSHKMMVSFYKDTNSVSDTPVVGSVDNKGPIEFVLYQTGFYYDYHAPQSSSSNQCYTGDYSYRNMQSSALSTYTNTKLKAELATGTRIRILDDSGSQKHSSGSNYTSSSWYTGTYVGYIRANSGDKVHISYVQVFDNNNNLLHDIHPIMKNGALVMYDFKTDDEYQASGTPGYHTDGTYTFDYKYVTNPPVIYDTKVAPPNYVYYDTLAELELMECPWVGMNAIIGGSRLYRFSPSYQWEYISTAPCFEVVGTLDEATGYFVDIYCLDDTKWYKLNNLGGFEEYGLYELTNDLSNTTYYTGKLVILTTDNHEYRWNGSQWIDVGSGNAALAPSGYTALTYIENASDAYINTGHMPNQNTRIVTSLQAVGNPKYGRLFGCGQWDAANGIHVDYEDYTTGRLHGTWGSASGWTLSSTTGDYNVHTYDMYDHYLYRDGILEMTFSSGSFQATSNLGIFTYINNSTVGVGDAAFLGKMYTFHLYSSGTMIRNLVPCRRNSDSAVGAYDIVNNVFYLSPNSTSFVGGDTATLPVEYDTKVAPSDNVHYDTLAELELMECPWVGMEATVGANNTPYMFTMNGWIEVDGYEDMYVTFVPESSATFSFSQHGLQYSINGGSWTQLAENTQTPTVTSSDNIRFKGTLPADSSNGIGTFSATGNFTVYGNSMSLLYGNNFIGQTELIDYAFFNLFRENTYVTDASNFILPARKMSDSCYRSMFNGCTSLTAIPDLPATTMASACYREMFQATAITTAPDLPATTLADNCYRSIFYDCTSLETPPSVLPATTLADYCYYYMFMNCTALTYAPEMRATTLAESCYMHMFRGCTSLTTAPEMRATTLAESCYYNMFRGCTSLTTAPALPATTVYANCYREMFRDCTSLTTAPEILPATTLADSCYYSMFYGCTSLRVAPVLPATTLVSNCYYQLFYGCSNLIYIKALFTTTPSSSYTSGWVNSVSSAGMFEKNPNATWTTTGSSAVPTTWTVVSGYTPLEWNISSYQGISESPLSAVWNPIGFDLSCTTSDSGVATIDNSGNVTLVSKGDCTLTATFSGDDYFSARTITMNLTVADTGYLTFVSKSDNNEISFKCSSTGSSALRTISVSTDGGSTWTSKTSSSAGTSLGTLNTGEKMLVKGTNTAYATSTSIYNTFGATGDFSLEGNIMSLIYGDNYTSSTEITADYTFLSLFDSCVHLTGASKLSLPARTLTQYCYYSMFYGCTALTAVPALPATILASNCYRSMFNGCTALTSAPELNALVLATYCYSHMFRNTALTSAPALPATTLQTYCYNYMFYGCTALESAPVILATTLATYCCNYMFYGCTSLTESPILSALTLVNNCYDYMFTNCSSLRTITALFTSNNIGSGFTTSWVSGVASTGTRIFYRNPNASWKTSITRGNNTVPSGWTITDYTP